LEISANFPIDKIRWEPARWLSCTDCLNPVARPAATTIYRAIVFSENGCDLSANFRLDVGPFDGFFIPNSFSPNGDGVNDHYFFHADERVEVIEEVMIFDRWGKLLFQRSDMAPNSADLGWDGRDQNQPVQVGVYTYYASIKLYNGQVKIYKGDLTLLR
jgi:gliding motility-associated-like protein